MLLLKDYTYHIFPDAKPGGEGDLVEDTAGNDGYLYIGGTNLLAIRVLENLIGTVTEEAVPYESVPEIPSKYEPVAAQLTGAYLVNVSEEKEDIDRIKEADPISSRHRHYRNTAYFI